MMYAVYEEFFEDIDKKLKKIANKCKKCGNSFVYKVVGTEYRKNEKDNNINKFYMIEVEGTAKIDDWECVAVLDIHSEGNVIRRINTTIDIPERFKTSENVCEHCGTKRARNNLYIIHNVVTDDFKQVGGDCLKLYTGGLSLEYVTAWIDGITKLEKCDGNMKGCKGKAYYDVQEVVETAAEIIDVMGYFNGDSVFPTKFAAAIMLQKKSTYENVKELNYALYKANINDVDFSSNDFYKKNTEARAKEIIEHYKNLDDGSEFISNVKILLNEGYIERKDLGYICYLPEGYKRFKQEEENRRENKEYYGEVGKRYKGIKAKSIDQVAVWEGSYGLTYLYRIILADDSVLTWKASNSVCMQEKEIDTITFTVKNHVMYKGEKQTQVTRCKITMK